MAVNRGKKNADGTWDDVTTWYDVACFKEVAENAAESLVKGDEVICEGYVEEPRTYEKKDGTVGVSLPFVANALGLSLRWAPAAAVQKDRRPQNRRQAPPKPEFSDEPF